MKEITTYLTFAGNAREAMTFYKKCLGGELHLVSFADSKIDVPKEAQNHIMHARLSFGSMALMASDSFPGSPLTIGNNFAVTIACESVAEIEKIWAALSEKGRANMPLQETDWALRFGHFTDRFGINWFLNLDKPH